MAEKPSAIREREKYLSIREFADVCGVAPLTIYREIRPRQNIRAVKIGGQWRIPDDEARRYLAGEPQAPAPVLDEVA